MPQTFAFGGSGYGAAVNNTDVARIRMRRGDTESGGSERRFKLRRFSLIHPATDGFEGDSRHERCDGSTRFKRSTEDAHSVILESLNSCPVKTPFAAGRYAIQSEIVADPFRWGDSPVSTR